MILKKVYGMLAILLMFGLVLTGCPEEDDGIVSTMGMPDISEAPPYPSDVNFVRSENEARELFRQVSFAFLNSVDDYTIFKRAFETKYKMSQEEFREDAFGGEFKDIRYASFSVDIYDTEELGKTSGAAGTISGSNKGSLRHSLVAIRGPSGTDDWYVDSIHSSVKSDRTFKITGGAYAGIIKMECQSSRSETPLYVEEREEYVDIRYKTSSNYTKKVSAAVTVWATVFIYDHDTYTMKEVQSGARFRFSYATDSSSSERTTKSSGSTNYSDVEVYNNAGEKVYTISSQGINYPSLGDFTHDAFVTRYD